MHSLNQFLEQIGETDFLLKAKEHNINNIIEKFALLHIFQQHIAHYFLENYNEFNKYEDIILNNEVFSLARHIIKEKNKQFKRMHNTWDVYFNCFDFNKLEQSFCKLASYSAMDRDIAMEWVDQKLNDADLNIKQKTILQELKKNIKSIGKGNRGDPFKLIV